MRPAARAAARAALSVRFGAGGWPHPARVALCVAVPLAAGLATGRISWGMVAGLGSFTGFYAHAEPYRWRALLLGGIALGLAAAVVAGGLAAGSAVAVTAVAAAVAATAAFFCLALDVGPPREHMLILVCLVSASLPVRPENAWGRGALTLAGGAIAWAIAMAGWFRDRTAPERRTVAAGLESVAAFLADPRGRHAAVLAVRAGNHAVSVASRGSAARLAGAQEATEELLDAALSLHDRGEPTRREWTECAVRLAGVLRGGRQPPPADQQPAGSSAHGGLGSGGGARPVAAIRAAPRVDAALNAVAVALARADGAAPIAADGSSLRAALGAHSLAPPTALRAAVAVGAAVALGSVLRPDRPYWIAQSVSAVLQGQTVLVGTRRAIERAAGTAVGVVVAAAVLAVEPRAWVVVATIVLLQFVIEAVIVSSYAVAVVFITPLTLLLSELGAPGSVDRPLLAGRLLDTVLGCLLGFAAARLLWPGAARPRLAGALRRAIDAVADRLESALGQEPDPDAVRSARRRLHVELVNLRAVSDAALGEALSHVPRTDRRWPIVASVERLGHLALGVPEAPAQLPDGLRATLSALAAAAGEDGAPRALPVPRLPGLPRLQAELDHLGSLVGRDREA